MSGRHFSTTMRFALVTAHYQPATVVCGVGDYTRCLRQALERLGHQCSVLTSSSSQSDEKDIYRVSGRWGTRDLIKARRTLRAVHPDVVIMQYTPEQYGYGVMFKLLPLQLAWGGMSPLFITTFHTLVGGRWIARVYAALLAAESHGVVSCHKELSGLYRRRLPWWAWKLREIPIGANIPVPTMERGAAREGLRRRLGLAPHTPVLGTFGFPSPGKGLETLFQAIRLLNDSSVVHLVCVGETREEDRRYRSELDALAQRLKLDQCLHWLGRVPEREVADLLLGADAYIVPYDDGASLRRGTLMAGFQIGIPIVTTAPRYADPSLRPGETILSIPHKSPEALAHCIRSLLADPALQARLRQGTGKVASQFDWNTIAEQYVQFAMQLQAQRQRPA
jgi:glycosyltransferase involved in cell wall biosynthesis